MTAQRERLVRGAVVMAIIAALAIVISLAPGEIRWALAWERRDLFLTGLGLTVVISSGAVGIGLILGVIAALFRVSRSVALDQIGRTYVEVVRGTPFLVQLYLWYWCIAQALQLHGLFGPREAAIVGAIGLGVFGGAYIAEVVRGAIESIDRGQWEAARSLGLSHAQALRHVVLPQCARRLLPPLTGEAVSIVKESSLLSIIGVAEITYHAKNLQAREYETWAAFICLAALYLVVTLPLTLLTRRMERRLAGEEALPVARL